MVKKAFLVIIVNLLYWSYSYSQDNNIRVYSSNSNCTMYQQGYYGLVATPVPYVDHTCVIKFEDGGISVYDSQRKAHFYPYIGESSDGRWTYYNPNSPLFDVIGVYADKGWKQITVVSSGLFGAETHRGYNFYGFGWEKHNEYWKSKAPNTQNNSTNYPHNMTESNISTDNNHDSDYVVETCSFCNGTGQNPSCEYGPQYTSDVKTYEYCSICRTTKESHYHLTCPSCGGKGKTKRRIKW